MESIRRLWNCAHWDLRIECFSRRFRRLFSWSWITSPTVWPGDGWPPEGQVDAYLSPFLLVLAWISLLHKTLFHPFPAMSCSHLYWGPDTHWGSSSGAAGGSSSLLLILEDGWLNVSLGESSEGADGGSPCSPNLAVGLRNDQGDWVDQDDPGDGLTWRQVLAIFSPTTISNFKYQDT